MFRRGGLDFFLGGQEVGVDCGEVHFRLGFGGRDVAGDIQVILVVRDFLHGDAAREARLLASELVGLDYLVDMLVQKAVLALALFKVFRRVDEEHVVGLAAFFQHQDTDRDARGEEQVGRQADDGVDVAVLQELLADAGLHAAAEQDAVRQDDGHDAVLLQKMEAVEQEGEVRSGARREAVVLEAHVCGEVSRRVPAVAEGRVRHYGVEVRHLGRIGLAQHVPVIDQGVTVEDGEGPVAHAMQEHVHAGEVVGGDVFFLPVDHADAVRPHAPAHVEQERAGAAGEIQHVLQAVPLACGRVLAVERDDAGEDGGNLLRRVELPGFLARACGELADEVFIGIAQSVRIRGKGGQLLGQPRDDLAGEEVALALVLPQLVGGEIDFGEQAPEGIFKGFLLDMPKALAQGLQQVVALGAGQLRYMAPEIVGVNDIVQAAAQELFKLRHIVGVGFVPCLERGTSGSGFGPVRPKFLPRRSLVGVRQIAQEKEGKHIVAEVVRVHGAAQLVGNGPEGRAQLFLRLFGHGLSLCVA